jgi:hypothetical protein
MFMNEIDEIAHVIQLSIAPVFLLTGVGTLLNVLSASLASSIVPGFLSHDWKRRNHLGQPQPYTSCTFW